VYILILKNKEREDFLIYELPRLTILLMKPSHCIA